MQDKGELRVRMRAERRRHSAAIHDGVRALLFKRPPAALLDMIPAGSVIGLYHAGPDEAPCSGYARFFADRDHTIALPRMETGGSNATMRFAVHTDPYAQNDLVPGPFGILQPSADAAMCRPAVLVVPLLAFTPYGDRLGQGGGHYDRWLSEHSGTVAIGMGFDSQMVEELPTEPHDMKMDAIVTPTRLYGPF